MTEATLFYVADPMCSWCWGFARELAELHARLPHGLVIRYVMGGLAPDSDDPMPAETRAYVQDAWREVARVTGAAFNWEFWERCAPRRSTYPACRAVIAARLQRPAAEAAMFDAIQRAYYAQAKNPSDREVLVGLAGELEPPLDIDQFNADWDSGRVDEVLREDFALRRELGVQAFPSLVLRDLRGTRLVMRGFASADEVLATLDSSL